MKILDHKQIDQKIKRLAYEIYENNSEVKSLVFLGINNNGRAFAELLASTFATISPQETIIGSLSLNPASPTTSDVELDLDVKNLRNKTIIIVDDVANTGRTLYYALKPLMNHLPRKIEVAVLVDRMHKTFPINVRYVGLSLATTLKENIKVDVLKKTNRAAFLQ